MAIKIRASKDVTPSTQSVNVRGDVSTPAPELQALQGLAGAGQQVAGVVGDMQIAENIRTQQDEFANARIADADAYNEFVQTQQNNPDWRTDEENYEAWSKKNETAQLKSFTNNTAKDKFGQYLRAQNSVRLPGVRATQRGKHKQEIISRMPETLEGFARNGLEEQGKAYIQELLEGGWITGAQKNSFDRALDATIQEQQKATAEKLVTDQVFDIAIAADAEKEGSGWDATLKWLNDPNTAKELSSQLNMSLDDIDGVLENVRTQASLANADKVKQEETAQLEESNAVWDKIAKAEFDGINAFIKAQPNLTGKQQTALQEKAESRAKAINADKPDPFLETNSQVYFNTLRNIDNITIPELQALTGKGLSIADYEKLSGMKDKDSPLNKPSSKRAQSAISRIRGIDVGLAIQDAKSGEEVIAATAREGDYLRIQNDLDDWIDENKDDPSFDSKLKAKTEELLQPIIEDVSLNWLESILSPKVEGGIPFFSAGAQTLLRSEGEELAQERSQAIKKEAVYKALTKEEQDRVILKIENGKSGQQAISEVRQRIGGGAGGSFDAPDPIREAQEPILVSTKLEYDKLPSGTKYIDKNGNVGVKK